LLVTAHDGRGTERHDVGVSALDRMRERHEPVKANDGGAGSSGAGMPNGAPKSVRSAKGPERSFGP
jgi:hypothetical protein